MSPSSVDQEVKKTSRLFLDLFTSPQMYPRQTDFAQLSFWKMSDPDDYSVLPHRGAGVQEEYSVSVDGLLELHREAHAPLKPPHFIFMTEYCCSTLLLKTLSDLKAVFGINEPYLLANLAMLRQRLRPSDEERWNSVLRLALTLLSRTYTDQQRAILKEWPPTNSIIKEILESSPDSRAVLLYSDLKTYLLAMLKKPFRRKNTRDRVMRVFANPAADSPLKGVEKSELTDAETGAYHWLTLMLQYQRLKSSEFSDRFYFLDCDSFLVSPAEVISRISQHFALPASNEEILAAVSGEKFHSYSKPEAEGHERYDRETREGVRAKLERQHEEELQEGMEWARTLLKGQAFDFPLESR